jgi:hypothetical protein
MVQRVLSRGQYTMDGLLRQLRALVADFSFVRHTEKHQMSPRCV